MSRHFQLVVHAPSFYKTHPLAVASLRLGRARDNDIVVGDSSISRQQLTIEVAADSVTLTVADGSQNLVLLDGIAYRRVRLGAGRLFQIGKVRFAIIDRPGQPSLPEPAPAELPLLRRRWSNAQAQPRPSKLARLAPALLGAALILALRPSALEAPAVYSPEKRPDTPEVPEQVLAERPAVSCVPTDCLAKATDFYQRAHALASQQPQTLLSSYQAAQQFRQAVELLGARADRLPSLEIENRLAQQRFHDALVRAFELAQLPAHVDSEAAVTALHTICEDYEYSFCSAVGRDHARAGRQPG